MGNYFTYNGSFKKEVSKWIFFKAYTVIEIRLFVNFLDSTLNESTCKDLLYISLILLQAQFEGVFTL